MRFKRVFDLFFSTFGLLFFSPLLLVIAILIKLEDGQSIFFRQERIGFGKRPFRILKFRSMRDGEVTNIGRWVRRTGLDEVPQFWNVLCGQMSIVGPRPLTEADIQRLGWNDDAYALRWSVRPGISGLAQLFGGGKGPRIAFVLDRRYIAQAGLLTDLRVLILSFAVNVFGKQRVRTWSRPSKNNFAL